MNFTLPVVHRLMSGHTGTHVIAASPNVITRRRRALTVGNRARCSLVTKTVLFFPQVFFFFTADVNAGKHAQKKHLKSMHCTTCNK